MPLKNYAPIFLEIKKSKFLKVQATVLFLITYIDWTILPFVTKLEGTYLPVYMISVYMLIGALDGFVQPLFQNVKIYNIYLFAIGLDIIQIGSYLLLNHSILLFTYAILTIFTIQGITFEIARIHTVDFMQDESVELKDYLMIRSFMISGAIVAGSITSMIFDYFTKELFYVLIYLTLLGLVGIVLQFMLFRKFKKRVVFAEIIVETDRKEVFEKMR
jgi:hypothetical protein